MEIEHLFSSSEYEIIEKLGEGGMGMVFKARMAERMVAIKVVSPKVAQDKEFQKRFLREMQVVSNFDHPNIVSAVDWGVDIEKDMYFVVLEYVDGQSLGEILKQKGQIKAKTALWITRHVALGLGHAHEHGVVHRDIKPDNILIGRDHSIKVTDFGLVKPDEKKKKGKGLLSKNVHVTTKNVILGSPLYIAPERARPEKELDIRSDIYSLGVTLYHMLTGRPPFVYESSVRIIAAHCFEEFPSLEEKVTDLPRGVKELVDKMTHKEKDQRFSTPGEVAEAIDDIEV